MSTRILRHLKLAAVLPPIAPARLAKHSTLELITPGTRVVLLSDGAFDGIDLQHTLQEAGWSYVRRTGSNVTASWDGTPFRLETVGWCS